MAIGNGADRAHVGALTIQMDRDDRPGPGRDGGLDLRRVDRVRAGLGIDEHRRRAREPDRFCRGEKRVGRRDALVPGPDPQGEQGEPDCVRAVAHAHRILGLRVFGELTLETFQHRTENILAALEHLAQVGVDLGLDVVILPDMPVKGDFHGAVSGWDGWDGWDRKCRRSGAQGPSPVPVPKAWFPWQLARRRSSDF